MEYKNIINLYYFSQLSLIINLYYLNNNKKRRVLNEDEYFMKYIKLNLEKLHYINEKGAFESILPSPGYKINSDGIISYI